jgi:predicted aconitase
MEILVALGEIYGARRLVPVSSVQVSGVSYKNLGDAGIEFLSELAEDGKARVKTTLNPAGMDLENWRLQGIDPGFASKQLKVIDAYRRLGLEISCTCTPYLAGNEPGFGEHIAWGESSAVVYANSVLGARTNREGGPSALAASLTGRTPLYGYHLDANRVATLTVDVKAELSTPEDFAAMGYSVGKVVRNGVPYFRGIREAGLEESKELSAALASSGGVAMYHMEGVTPEAKSPPSGTEAISFGRRDLAEATAGLNDEGDPDFVSVGLSPGC